MKTDNNSQRVWAIRAGRGGEAHELFLNSRVIVLADAGLGDLTKVKPTRDAFYAIYREMHPDETPSGSAGIVGKFFRFAQEVKIGDLVVYPALSDKNIYIGEVTGSYSFVTISRFPHQRRVQWNYVIPKFEFSQSSIYELGAARTFFEFKRNMQELKRKINSGSLTCFPLGSITKATTTNKASGR